MQQIKITVMQHTYCDICGSIQYSPKARIECKTDSVNPLSNVGRVDTVIDICNNCANFISTLTKK